MTTSARRKSSKSSTFVLAAAWLTLTTPAFATVVELNATEAIADGFSMFSGGHAFWLRDLFDTGESSDLRKYLFVGTPTFRIDDQDTGAVGDDTIEFFGSIVSSGDSARTFDFDVLFDRIGPGEPVPPDSPKRELIDEAYVDHMPPGPIDPSTWSLWLLTEGTLTGTMALAGAELTLEHRGPAFQLGVGASGKNIAPGFSGWLDWETESQASMPDLVLRDEGRGDININFFDRSVPVPATAALIGLGLISLGVARRRRRAKSTSPE